MAGLTFATPLPQSSRSEVLEWAFPKPFQHYVLTGKSRAAWHTSFLIPALNLCLDAGLCVNAQRPKHIFLTHGHSDHTLLTPAFVKRSDPPDIVCPVEMTSALDAYIFAKSVLNQGGVLTPEEAEQEGFRQTHATYGVRAGDVVPLRRLKNISATAFACDHTVPCLGYVFSMTTQKLKQEYTSLSGQELKGLREQGVEITAPLSTPIFAFLGDTSAKTLADGPEWLRQGIPVVITECSFLYEEHRAQAELTKHTIWADLEPVIRKWPQTKFVLTHFSLRYTDEDVRKCFAELVNPPANMVIWVDGLPEK